MVFEEAYDQSVGRASLNYLSLGIGFVVGLQISGPLQDKTWRLPHSKLHPSQGTTDTKALIFTIPRKPVPPRRAGTAHSLTHDPTKAIPEYRLPLTLPFSLLIPIGLFIYGWSAEHKRHWIFPNIGACILAMGLIISFNCAQVYVVDTYTTYAVSATTPAAARTMAGFVFPLFAPGMYESMGLGWGNSLLGFVSLGLGIVAPVALWRWGKWLRARSTYCTD
ncbi:MAG: hypothetical protein LQ345_005950 [Seirophora villosa]|nr:MAG: hypothetical protein LQ345_005950 [Seirophora villosa]